MKLLINSISIALIVSIYSCSQEKMGYVDIGKLYESFEYKKILTGDYNKIKMARQRIVDSLEIELNGLATDYESRIKLGKADEQTFETKKKSLYALQRQYEEDNQVLSSSYNEKVIKQLNSYIKEFGKSNSYQLILGADNKGSVLFANDNLDVTEAVITYVNDRYKGEKGKK